MQVAKYVVFDVCSPIQNTGPLKWYTRVKGVGKMPISPFIYFNYFLFSSQTQIFVEL
jgi:hypothetical protein